MRRSTAALMVLAAGATVLTSPAQAATTDIVVCGPALRTPDRGLVKFCGEAEAANARNGYYVLNTGRIEWGPWKRLVSACGIKTTDSFGRQVLGYPEVAEAAETGSVTYGTQVKGIPNKQWGRWGYLNNATGLFYPTSGWYVLEGGQPGLQPDPGTC